MVTESVTLMQYINNNKVTTMKGSGLRKVKEERSFRFPAYWSEHSLAVGTPCLIALVFLGSGVDAGKLD